MKLLGSSDDLQELERVIKRPVWASIPCAICKDSRSSQFSVWIQQDADFPLALPISVNRDAPRRLPHWARVYDSASLPTRKIGAAGLRPVPSRKLSRAVIA